MSEAMTNSEIEDVLSSIRRLVAQEVKPAQERLILTAAHRVAPVILTEVPAAPLAVVPVDTPAPQPVADWTSSAANSHAEQVGTGAVSRQMDHAAHEQGERNQGALELTLAELEQALVIEPPFRAAFDASSTESEREFASAPRPDDAETSDEAEFAMIDEADLQKLIARLVREELQGQLGEKITLQVRKLVRTEIARALDERGLIG